MLQGGDSELWSAAEEEAHGFWSWWEYTLSCCGDDGGIGGWRLGRKWVVCWSWMTSKRRDHKFCGLHDPNNARLTAKGGASRGRPLGSSYPSSMEKEITIRLVFLVF